MCTLLEALNKTPEAALLGVWILQTGRGWPPAGSQELTISWGHPQNEIRGSPDKAEQEPSFEKQTDLWKHFYTDLKKLLQLPWNEEQRVVVFFFFKFLFGNNFKLSKSHSEKYVTMIITKNTCNLAPFTLFACSLPHIFLTHLRLHYTHHLFLPLNSSMCFLRIRRLSYITTVLVINLRKFKIDTIHFI